MSDTYLIAGLLVGFVLLVIGGETLVRGAVAAAEKIGISPLVIGLTLVGFGTSMPEMVVGVQAVFADSPGLAMGGIVGSNISNILLIIGFSALLLPMPVARETVVRDGTAVMLATLLFIGIATAMPFNRIVGLLFLVALILYLVFVWFQDRHKVHAQRIKNDGEDIRAPLSAILLSVGLAIIGMVIVVTGGALLVDSAIGIARRLDVKEEVIGLTIVAIGTSLPELVTAVIAAIKRQSDVAVGSVIGSNMFNLLSIGGVTAVLSPEPFKVADHILHYDNVIMLVATVLLLAFAWSARHVSRAEGFVLFICYLGYIGSLVLFELNKAGAIGA
ncbi:MAG: calcium/sodium antiporter [Pseudomonadota bacterium]